MKSLFRKLFSRNQSNSEKKSETPEKHERKPYDPVKLQAYLDELQREADRRHATGYYNYIPGSPDYDEPRPEDKNRVSYTGTVTDLRNGQTYRANGSFAPSQEDLGIFRDGNSVVVKYAEHDLLGRRTSTKTIILPQEHTKIEN